MKLSSGIKDDEDIMEDIEDVLLEETNFSSQHKIARHTIENFDASLQAPNANDFSNARLIEEV